MDSFAKDLVTILQYLLPGFVAAWIFYNLTSYPKPSQFERIVQALIFTAFIGMSVTTLETLLKTIGGFYAFSEWKNSYRLPWSVLFAVFFGFIFSYFANNDKLHKVLRRWSWTPETSFPSVWFGAFHTDMTFVVLHFKDGRRLYGWPYEWPSESTKGHFVIREPAWIDKKRKDILIEGVKSILIDVNDVRWVEFLEKTMENNDEQESAKSPSSPKASKRKSR